MISNNAFNITFFKFESNFSLRKGVLLMRGAKIIVSKLIALPVETVSILFVARKEKAIIEMRCLKEAVKLIVGINSCSS